MIDLRQKCILNTCYNTLKKNWDKEVIHIKRYKEVFEKNIPCFCGNEIWYIHLNLPSLKSDK